jgi:hypothetical protein
LLRQSDERALLLCGQDPSGRHVTALSEFDVERGVWSDWPVPLQQSAPCARWCSATCAVGESNVFLFSGNNWLRCLRDAWLFDGRVRQWSRLPLAGVDEPLRSPEARDCAVAAAIDERLVVMSGGVVRAISQRAARMLNQIWLVDTLGATVDDVWRLIALDGDYLIGRESHSMLVDHQSQRLVLFGGSTLLAQMHPQHEQFVPSSNDNGDHLLNDVVYVDLKTWRVRVVEPDGMSPHVPGRQGHAAMIVCEQRLMVICGGEVSVEPRQRTNAVHVWHLDHEAWLQSVHVGGVPPAPFSFASSCALSARGSLLLMGGFGRNTKTVMRLDFAQPPALFELCSRFVARSLPDVALPPALWSRRARQLRDEPPAPLRLTSSDLYWAELYAFFADVVEHLRVDVDPSRPAIMRAWRESGIANRLASSLAVAPVGTDDETVVQAFRDAANFALLHHRSLFAAVEDDAYEEWDEEDEEDEEEDEDGEDEDEDGDDEANDDDNDEDQVDEAF